MAAAQGLVSDPFRQRAGQRAGRAVRRRRPAHLDRAVLRRRPARRAATTVLLDFATSVVAEGKVLVASQGGKKLPDNALIEPDGTMSGDPHMLYGDYEPTGPRNYRQGKGAIRAFGDHKGSGLAIMCELLGGSLTGAGATELRDVVTNGMLSFYIDPKVLDPKDFFSQDMARYIDYLKSSKPVQAGGEVLIPGEPEARNRAERLTTASTFRTTPGPRSSLSRARSASSRRTILGGGDERSS